MRNIVIAMVAGISAQLLLGSINHAWAQPSTSVCEILASKITPDISSQTSTDFRSSFFQEFVQDDRFSSWEIARTTQLDVGLNVVGYVDFTLGTSSDESSWSTNWNLFRTSRSSNTLRSRSLDVASSKWNPVVIETLLNGCAYREFYAQITSIETTYDGFTIQMFGIGEWFLKGIKPTIGDSPFTCSGDEKATDIAPIRKIGTAKLSCRKDPNVTLTLIITSTLGDAGPLTLYSKADAVTRKYEDSRNEISLLKTSISTIEARIESLNKRMQSTIQELNQQFSKADYTPNDNSATGANIGGGSGQQIDCGPRKFLSKLRLKVEGHENINIYSSCANLPEFKITPW